jgi:hypothetical protein
VAGATAEPGLELRKKKRKVGKRKVVTISLRLLTLQAQALGLGFLRASIIRYSQLDIRI